MNQHTIRAIVLVALSALCSIAAMAYNVTGEVTDSVGEPESYATVRIYAKTDTVKPVKLGTTDADGRFDIALPAAGAYRLNVTSVGRRPLNVPFSVSASAPVAAVGRLLTEASAESELAEVTVTATRPVVTREIDRIGYDVQADDDAKTIQLDELLKRVPMVSVDDDGTIRVKGSTSFKVYKNGRPNNSMSRNAKDIFKAIPASMIKKIEVITDPGAREDAEGTTAILNIITLQETTVKGVMGNVGVGASTNGMLHGNLWLTSQIDKVTMSLFGGGHSFSRRMGESSDASVMHYEDSGNTLRSLNHMNNHGGSGWGGLEASWEPDTLNLVTAEFNGWFYNVKNTAEGSTEMTSAAGERLYSYTSSGFTDPMRYISIDGSVNYQHSTRRKGETLTLSYMISANINKSNATSIYGDMVNMPVDYTGIITGTRMNFLEQTIQGDWTRPLTEHHKLDVGFKYINRRNHSRDTREYIGLRDEYVNFLHRTQVAALYADYRLQLGRFGARAGLRWEYSHLAAEYRDGSDDPFGSNLSDWVPNAAVNYSIDDRNTVKIGYSSHISRPGIDYLNPTVTSTPSSVSYGNPGLNSGFTQSLDLNYSYMGPKVNLDLDMSYTFSNNSIISRQWLDDDITISTYDNGGRSRQFFVSMFLRWSMTSKTSVTAMANINYDWERNPSLGISHGDWGGFWNMRLTQRLPWKLSLTGYISEWMGWSSLYQRSKPRFCDGVRYGLSLNRSFLKEDRLSVRMAINNPFGKSTRYMRSEPINTGYTGYNTSYRYHSANVVSIEVSYRFGSLNARVKKTAKSISNDDLVGGSRGGQGQGQGE